MNQSNYRRHLEVELLSLLRMRNSILPEWQAKKLSYERAKENLQKVETLAITARRVAIDRQEEFRVTHSYFSANAMKIREIKDELFPFGEPGNS
jgi:hypothetical protein